MKARHRILLVAGLTLLLLPVWSVAAAPACSLSETTCMEPTASDDDVWDTFADFDTSEMNEKECRNLCRSIRRISEKLVNNRDRCIKAGNKFDYMLEVALCGGDAECKASAASASSNCNDLRKQEAADGDADCADLESECLEDCANGTLNPTPPAPA